MVGRPEVMQDFTQSSLTSVSESPYLAARALTPLAAIGWYVTTAKGSIGSKAATPASRIDSKRCNAQG